MGTENDVLDGRENKLHLSRLLTVQGLNDRIGRSTNGVVVRGVASSIDPEPRQPPRRRPPKEEA